MPETTMPARVWVRRTVSDSLDESYPSVTEDLEKEAKQWFRDFGDAIDGPWEFWTTYETLAAAPLDALATAKSGSDS